MGSRRTACRRFLIRCRTLSLQRTRVTGENSCSKVHFWAGYRETLGNGARGARGAEAGGEEQGVEALSLGHADDLYAAGKTPTIWRYMPVEAPKSVDDVRAWIQEALEKCEAGLVAPFAIIHLGDDKAVGSTRFLNIESADRGVEIGWTWIGVKYHRSAVNTHCKYLLLEHAFETLGAIRVQFKTDSRNQQSRKAIERIGARREGILRNHMIMPDGHYRDTVIYSITLKEWPEKKKSLRLRLL